MSRDQPQVVSPPTDSAIANWYSGADLLDAQAIPLPVGVPDDAITVAHLLLDHPPPAFRALMAVRDAVMSRLGVKSSSAIRNGADDRIDFFPIQSSNLREVVLGEDDRHLDFRTSIMIVPQPGGRLIVTTTAVRCHNRLGRLYLWLITPFHVAIVRGSLARLRARYPTVYPR